MENSFANLNLAPPLQRAIADIGYTCMTPIQAKAIPLVLQDKDMMGAAQTGTGKTAAFSLPLLQKLMGHENSSASPARHPVRALVLLPTRELADQVSESMCAYAKYTKLKVACVFGGMDMKPQSAILKAGVEILIATPGRLLDHIEAKNCALGQVEFVVLDEADRMLDIGFLPDLQRILSYLPKQRQTLLFSATFSPEIKRLAQSYLQDPVTVEVARANATASSIVQRMVEVSESDKRQALVQLLRDEGLNQAIIFTNSKMGCSRLARVLEREGLKASALHGDKTQDERLKTLVAFKQGEIHFLVATDVAARGLDVSDLPAVFNYDLPFHAEDYVHRIGRTGRAGAQGVAISFVEPEQNKTLREIEKLVKKTFTLEHIELAKSPSVASRNRSERFSGEKPYKEKRERKNPIDASEVGYAFPRHKKADPIFDHPYEEKTTENRAKEPTVSLSIISGQKNYLSRYIKSKNRQVAVLLESGQKEKK